MFVSAPGWQIPRHWNGERYFNPWATESPRQPLKAAGWLLSFPFRKRPESEPTPVVRTPPEALHAAPDGKLRATWIGHATVLLQMGGLNVITDPVFARRASPFSFAGPERQVALPLQRDELPPIHVVLISHDHYDHLDLDTVAFLAERDCPLILVPLGVSARLIDLPEMARVLELDWGQFAEHQGVRFHCAPAKHFSGRGLRDRASTLWCSWYIEPADASLPRIYNAADTGYGPHFAEVRKHLGSPDLILMPIGAYEPRWFMRPVHVDPEEAVQGLVDLGALEHDLHVLPIHHGTFRLTDEPLHEPREKIREHAEARSLPLDRLHVLPVGGSLEL